MTGPSDVDALERAVTYALLGVEVGTDLQSGATTRGGVDPAELLSRLGGPERLHDYAAETRATGGLWPHPVPERLRDGIGSAHLHAILDQLLELIHPAAVAGVRRTGSPDADEIRLLRDVPPHH